jgi:rsbT co-antagonist protein RsbR
VPELRRRIAELEAELQARADELWMLRSVLNSLPYAVFWKDRGSTYRGCNQRFAADIDLPSPAAIVGLTDFDLPWQPSEAQGFREDDARIMAAGQPEYDDHETVIYPNGRQEWFETHKIPLRDAAGEVGGLLTTYINITDRKQAQAIVQSQAALLAELSTPLIPLNDNILVMPLVGAIDSRRAQQILETLLVGMAERQARVTILDITGVPVIDTQVAAALLRAAQAARLLGAQVVLTGIRPEVAQTLVGLGVDFGSVVTRSTLQRGIAYALTT